MNATDLMEYEARSRSMVVSYLLWAFLGMFGAHRFYNDSKGVAITQLILTVILIGTPVTLVWIIVDAFLIPGWTQRHNMALVAELRQRELPASE